MLSIVVYGIPGLFNLGILFLIAAKLYPRLIDSDGSYHLLTRQKFRHSTMWAGLSCCAVNGVIFALFLGTMFFKRFVEERPTELLTTIYFASFLSLSLTTPLFYQCQMMIWGTRIWNSRMMRTRTRLVFGSWFLGGLYCHIVYAVVAFLVLPMSEILIIQPPPKKSFTPSLFEIGPIFSTLLYTAIFGLIGVSWVFTKLPKSNSQESGRARHSDE